MADRELIFIGSSTEKLSHAEELVTALVQSQGHFVTPILWTDQSLWNAGSFTLESLIKATEKFSFAAFFAAKDDPIVYRGAQQFSTRANIWFEAGIFMAKNGRQSVFILIDEDDFQDLHIPSDLYGLSIFTYKVHDNNNPKSMES